MASSLRLPKMEEDSLLTSVKVDRADCLAIAG